MGAIADGFMAYAQPLLDQTDGSMPQMQRAMLLAQMCWNLALVPEDEQDAALNKFRPALQMTDADFGAFREQLLLPMIQRHREMFPGLHKGSFRPPITVAVAPAAAPAQPEKYPGTARGAPCPCGSGRKYKRCCGPRR